MNGELNEQQINNILSSQAVGRIACCEKGFPYIVPVTYAYDGHYIYAQSIEGKKLELMRENPNVSFEVDISHDINNWQSAVVFGQFQELEGIEAEKARELLFTRVLPLMTISEIHLHEHGEGSGHELSDASRIKPVMFRIQITEKIGRYERK
ncbi:MAG: pyridoxamine 5'-phosphate oxidase family protein [Chitinophagaceae bacterium]|jgi:nitroimidazol reductase NimA-like FMN-containing flavoprotein (pyridoxamine 5'-phosphate oxidase superfamily)